MNLFEILSERYVLPDKVRLFESFSGIGCQRMAFERLGIDYESVGISEIDKYAVMSYAAIHTEYHDWLKVLKKDTKWQRLFKKNRHKIDNQKLNKANELSKNYGDITKINGYDLPTIDVFTYSFPCTDLSKAGKQKGLSDTRSGLVYEVLRILHELKDLHNLPKVLIMENVVDLVQTKFIREFNEIQLELEQMGYSNYAETMNAKEYGVAQNRDRVFMVSILGDYYYEFPQKIKLEKRLKDYLESEVDEKYYLTESMLKTFTAENTGNYPRKERFLENISNTSGVGNAITTRAGGRPTDNFLIEPICLNSKVDGKQPSLQDRIYDSDGISTAITTSFMPNVTEPIICASRGRNQQNPKSRESGLSTVQMVEVNHSGLCNTLTTVQKDNMVIEPLILQKARGYNNGGEFGECPPITSNAWQENNKLVEPSMRIRKLTPLECWRLMGIDDECFRKAEKVCSNSQLYKQAGNGIVVDVFVAILNQMRKETHEIHD